MIISEEKRKRWLDAFEHGDYAVIAKKTSVSSMTIANAIKSGKGKLKLMESIDNFFSEKLKVINQLNKVEND